MSKRTHHERAKEGQMAEAWPCGHYQHQGDPSVYDRNCGACQARDVIDHVAKAADALEAAGAIVTRPKSWTHGPLR